MGRPRSIPNLIGQVFERLFVNEEVSNGKRYFYRCTCDCGAVVSVLPQNLTSGNSKSCGCLNLERVISRSTIHGHSRRNQMRSPTMISWENMISRCYDTKHKSFKVYGGAGILVCDRWRSFGPFLEDMGLRPIGTTLDREDGTKGYELGNCRWATPLEQGNNLKSNRPLTHDGRTQNIKQWGAEVGMSHQAIAYRIKAGWSIADALMTKPDHGNAFIRGTR